MKKKYLIIFLVCFSFLINLSPAYSAIFVKFDGIDGESKDADHDKWCDVLNYDWQVSNPGPTGSRDSTAIIRPLIISKEFDKASPKILDRLLRGVIIPLVEIEVTATFGVGGRATYIRIEMRNARITNRSGIASGNDEAGPPEETVAIVFEEIKYTYTEYDDEGNPAGNVEFTWKVE
jgi:type VI secretion system secreted protein Hcp